MPIDFNALKIRKLLDLGKYDEQLKGQSLEVWVNLSYRVLAESHQDDRTPEQTIQLYCDLWNITVDEFETLRQEVDPGLWTWIIDESWKLVNQYSDERKKAEKA